ncbi:peptidase inhibitor family I36 protein [Streptomyces sp. O3]
MRSRLTRALASTAIAGGLILGASATATAAPDGADRATAGGFNVYQHDDYKGEWQVFWENASNLKYVYWSGDWDAPVNDGISSVRNWSSRTVVLHQHAGYNGRTYLSDPGDVDKDLSNNGMDNKVSSIQFR